MKTVRKKRLYFLLCLLSISGIGNNKIRLLLKRFKSAYNVLNSSVRELVQVEGIDRKLADKIKLKVNPCFAEEQLKLIETHNVRIVTYWDSEYPKLLKNIFDPPVVLYVKGNLQAEETKSVAIVGTRMPSSYGKVITEKFSAELCNKRITVVSGLARGIDTIAHKTCVSNGGRTIAILGSGVDKIYPYENVKLAEHILEKGAIISELPMGKGPDAPHFPRRNRIISGMSQLTLVVEAGESSGALITSDFALEQGRDVLAIPGNINNPKSVGTNSLIQQGAKLVTQVDDILNELKMGNHEKIESHISLTKDEEKILGILHYEPMHIDKIAILSGFPAQHVLCILLSLELKSLVKQVAGKHFLRI